MAGMTLKQIAKAQFFDKLQDYNDARTKEEFIFSSVRLHQAAGNVPARYMRYVRKAVKEKTLNLTQKED
jgi:hypothetical protein